MSESLFFAEGYEIQGAIFDVYRELGCGFLEAVYQECLERELQRRGVPFVAQKKLGLNYRGERLRQSFRLDLVCYDKILVEVKAANELVGFHRAQVLNYLKASSFRLGILVNFGSYPKATIERIVL